MGDVSISSRESSEFHSALYDRPEKQRSSRKVLLMSVAVVLLLLVAFIFAVLFGVNRTKVVTAVGTEDTTVPKSRGNKVQLSNEDHYQSDGEGNEHNAAYDHEAFLGKEQASEFDELSPEESKARLAEIVKKIDEVRHFN